MSDDRTVPDDASAADMVERLFRVPPRRRVLDNGLTLLHRPDFSADVVSAQAWIKTGSIHEGELRGSGLTHYLEHLLFKGTERRAGPEIGREVHAMGGSMNAYTSFDRTVYHIDAPAAALRGALDVLEDMVFHATLPAEEVERERDVILREIDMGRDDPDRELAEALFGAAFRRHPYGDPVIGYRELFAAVSRDELLDYYRARYVPNNVVATVAGAVDAETCDAAVEATFGARPRGRLRPAWIPSEPPQLAPRREDREGDYEIARGAVAFKAPGLAHADAPALDALAHALGGGESSLLWQRLREEERLVHFIEARAWNPGKVGLFWIFYGCDPGRQSEAEARVRAVIEEARRGGIAGSVVDKARRRALSAEINGRKTMSGQAARLGLGEVVIGDVDYPRRYLERLSALGGDELRAAAQEHLRPERSVAATLAPSEGSGQGDEASAGAEAPPAFEDVTLKNGVRLLLQPDARLPKLHFRVVMRGGPCFEPAGQRGISALAATLLTKDTARRSAAEIAEAVESIGGEFGATGGNNTISLSLEGLPADRALAVELVADALLAPSFDPETVERERDAQIADLREERDDVVEDGFRRVREAFFGEHPLNVSADGREDDLAALGAEDVRRHYAELARGGNLVVAVAGDFDRDAMVETLGPKLEEGLPSGAPEPVAGPFAGPPEPGDREVARQREQAVVFAGYPGPGLKAERHVDAEVLNELFSGMASRLFERVREEKGMAYFVGATRMIGLEEELFAFFGGTHPSQTSAVLAEIDAEVERVRSGGVEASELASCKTRLRAARVMGRQTLGARAMRAALNAIYGLPLDDDAEFERRLEAVDADALADFARAYFDPSRRVRLTVRPDGE